MPGSVRRDQVTITQDGQRSPLSAPAQLVEGMRQVVRVFDLQDVRAIGIAEARALVVGPALLHDGEVEPDLRARSEEHTSELQSLMRISYAVFCLKKKTKQ